MATLLQDLSERGLLDSTIVWWGGEFGRTPKVQWEPPWNGGRNHWGKVFSAALAGGGFKGGQMVGASDAPRRRGQGSPGVSGGSHRQHLRAVGNRSGDENCRIPQGLPMFSCRGADEGIKSAGLLKEIMSA